MELHESDENLMLRYQSGEAAAFAELYRRYERRLYGYLSGHLMASQMRDEVFQEVWTKLHRSRFRYDSQYKFAAWLFVITRSVLVDAFRKEGRTQKLPWMEQIANTANTAESAEPQSPKQIEGLAWQELAEQDRQAVQWRYLEDASFEEIGKKLGLRSVTVRQRISRALKKLKQKSKIEPKKDP